MQGLREALKASLQKAEQQEKVILEMSLSLGKAGAALEEIRRLVETADPADSEKFYSEVAAVIRGLGTVRSRGERS